MPRELVSLNRTEAVRKIDDDADQTATAETPSLLKLTSGTTAAPRAIRFRSEQLLADCDQICDTMGITDVDLNFGVIPISHSYGFSNLLTPLLVRGVPMVISRDRTPRAVLDDLARTNATVFPGMPLFYQAFCEMENVPGLPKLRLCISAGAPLSARRREKFPRQIWIADPFLLRRVRVRRDLLRSRRNERCRGIRRRADERCRS